MKICTCLSSGILFLAHHWMQLGGRPHRYRIWLGYWGDGYIPIGTHRPGGRMNGGRSKVLKFAVFTTLVACGTNSPLEPEVLVGTYQMERTYLNKGGLGEEFVFRR